MPVQRPLYRFENVQVDIASRQLTVDGVPPTLAPKAFRLLQYPVENSGRAIAYTRLPAGRPAQTWLHRLDGTPPVPIGRDSQSQRYARFLAEGKALRLLVRTAGGSDEIQDVSLLDGSIASFPVRGHLEQPSFSPGGQRVAFHDEQPVHRVWRLDVRTGQRKQLPLGDDAHGYAQYSEDGQWLSVRRFQRGQTQAGVRYPGGWSRDRRRILVAGNPGSGWALYSVARATHRLRRITGDLPLRMYVRDPRLSPAGDRLAYECNESKGNVFAAGFERQGEP